MSRKLTQAKPAKSKISTAIPAAAPDARITAFAALPDDSYLRQNQICQSAKNPTGLLPVSTSSLWRWVNAGLFPKPITLGPRCTAWKVGDVRAWLAAQAVAA